MLGQPVVLTATVTSANGSLSGTVAFSEGSTNWCTNASLDAHNTATCTIPSLSLGAHTFTATYSGDADDAASTSPSFIETIKQQPALALAVSTSPAVVTSNVTLTLTATAPSGTSPTGSVTFYDGATALGTATLNSVGGASWSTTSFSVGTHDLSAQFAGDTANASGTSNTVAEQITQAATLTVLSSSSSNPMIGTDLVLTGKVVSAAGPAPTGSVQFTDGSGPNAVLLGSSSLGANGIAVFTTNSLTPGTHSIVATYAGDTDNAASTSSGLAETVQVAGLTLNSSSNPSVSGQDVVFTAQLNAAVTAAPTGVAIFRDGGTLVASVP